MEFLQLKDYARDSAAARTSQRRLQGKEVGASRPAGRCADFGESNTMIDCTAQGFRVGNLYLRLIDYGDMSRVSNQTNRLSGGGGDSETSQCAIIGLEAGMGSFLKKQTLRATCWDRVEKAAKTIRDSE